MDIHEYRTRLDEQRYPYIAEAAKYQVDGEKLMLGNPKAVAEFVGEDVGLLYDAEERFFALAFDATFRLIGIFEIAHGTHQNAMVSPREVYQKLLMLGAAAWIGVHNHPSGNATPSKPDVELTKKLVDAGKLMCIPMSDHIIIGEPYFSFREADQMPE